MLKEQIQTVYTTNVFVYGLYKKTCEQALALFAGSLLLFT